MREKESGVKQSKEQIQTEGKEMTKGEDEEMIVQIIGSIVMSSSMVSLTCVWWT